MHFYTRAVSSEKSLNKNCDKNNQPIRNRMAPYDAYTMTYHDPPLMYDVTIDPGERSPVRNDLALNIVLELVEEHEKKTEIKKPLFGNFNAKLKPCCNFPKCSCEYRNLTLKNIHHDEFWSRMFKKQGVCCFVRFKCHDPKNNLVCAIRNCFGF